MSSHTAPLLLDGCSPRGSLRRKGSGTPDARTLTLLPLAALIFFEVSGGPFGTEDVVRAAGPLLTIAGFLVFPLVWSVPEALVTAELATAFPENSGYVAWVTAAFGPFWGFQEGLWSWISGVCDNALYPVMLAANLQIFFPQLESGWQRMPFLVGLSVLLSFLNYRGLNVVGHAVVTSAIAVLLPFILLCALSLPHINVQNYVQVDFKTVDWATFLQVIFWNLNYWDSVSTLAGEVRDPGRTFPKAMMLAVFLVVVSYLLPLLAGLGVADKIDDADWDLGYYGQVAKHVGGRWLAVWVVIAAGFSQVGQYQAEMASDSYQVSGMAERGFLPKVLGMRSKHGTPVIGIILSSLGVLTLASMQFVEIVSLLNAIYCLAELLEFAAFVALRITQPKLDRPYKVPLPTWGVILMLLPASILLLAVLALPFYFKSWITIMWIIVTILLGFALYPLLQLAKRRGWCEFEQIHFECAHVYGPDPPDVPDAGSDGYTTPLEPVGLGTEADEEQAAAAVALAAEEGLGKGHRMDGRLRRARGGSGDGEGAWGSPVSTVAAETEAEAMPLLAGSSVPT